MAATVKMTFTLDTETVQLLERAANRLAKPKSQIVRDAISSYGNQLGRLTDSERLEMLRVLNEVVPNIPKRSQTEVDQELAELRRARKSGGRKTPVE